MENAPNKILAVEYLNKAYKFHIDGQLSKAIELYKTSIEYFPTAQAHTFLGWVYGLQGDYSAAVSECYLAIHLDESFGNAYNDLGSYLILLGKYDDALTWLQKAICTPGYPLKHFSLFNIGGIYEIKGDWIKALSYYNMSLDLKPDYEPAKSAASALTRMLN